MEAPPRPTPPVPTPRTSTESAIAKVKRLHDQAYHTISEGIALEEAGKKDEAFALYQKGLAIIDDAVSADLTGTDCVGEDGDKAKDMVGKMRRTRKELLCRATDVQSSGHPSQDAPPTYEEYMRSQSTETSIAQNPYVDVNAALSDVAQDMEASARIPAVPRDADEVFRIPGNVQIFFVSPDGNVSAPSYPSELRIYMFSGEDGAVPNAPGFLQVGDWTYPLLPGQSPVLRSTYGAYMFPDVSSQVQGAAVGLIIPSEIDKETRQMFEDILTQMTAMVQQDASASEYSKNIASAAERIAQGLMYGAEKAGEWMNLGTEKLKQKIQPDATQKQVDPKVKQGVRTARNVTGTAVKVSGFVVSRVGMATMALGRYLAPHIRKQGSKIVSKVTNSDERRASQQVDNVLEVASGALQGFGTIYIGLEGAAKTLASNITNNTVQVVQHKYGPEVGDVTSDTMHTVGYAVMTGHNVGALGVKGIAKRTAKDAGKALVEDYKTKQKGGQDLEGKSPTSPEKSPTSPEKSPTGPEKPPRGEKSKPPK